MTIPNSYYDQLREKLKNAKITVKEDLDVVTNMSSYVHLPGPII